MGIFGAKPRGQNLIRQVDELIVEREQLTMRLRQEKTAHTKTKEALLEAEESVEDLSRQKDDHQREFPNGCADKRAVAMAFGVEDAPPVNCPGIAVLDHSDHRCIFNLFGPVS